MKTKKIQKKSSQSRSLKFRHIARGGIFVGGAFLSFLFLHMFISTPKKVVPGPPQVVALVEQTNQDNSENNSNNDSVTPAVIQNSFVDDNNQSDSKPKNLHSSDILRSKDYPQYKYQALATTNDPLLPGSWYHEKVQSSRAWDLSTGNSSTVIAVIDTGFALSHDELSNKWQINAGEQGNTTTGDHCWTGTPLSKQTNNCDDDQNGYADDWRGWDFDSDDNNSQTGMTNPDGDGTQHGTMVSSLIAATSNNAKGNAGLDWNAKIMPLQVLSDDGTGYTFDIAAAIEYATDNGAKIINMSLGGNQFDQALLDAIIYAKSQGVLVIAASGNCGASSVDNCAGYVGPGRMAYPAKYEQVLSVGATSSDDTRASFSSYGADLDLVAPGASVGPIASWSSTYMTNGYVSSASGTSFASPIVAGIAGLLISQMNNPSVDQITNVLMESVDKVAALGGAQRSDTLGVGRVNAHKATVLAKAKIDPATYGGTAQLQTLQPARGAIARSRTGNIAADEWVVIACRVSSTDSCSSVVNGASNIRITPLQEDKGSQFYYMFLSGSSLNSGSNTISIHSRNYSTAIGSLSK